MLRRYSLPPLVRLLFLSLVGCDGVTESEGDSHVQVLLTDAPADEITEAHVVIERVELLGMDETQLLLLDDPEPFDLMTLRDGVTATLADLDIPDGTYTQLRVIVNEEAFVAFDDGTEATLKVPSGSQTGIKIPLPTLDLADDFVEITVDFDVNDSFVKRGNSGKGYIFKPVLKPAAVYVDGEPLDIEIDEDEDVDL